MSYPNDFLQDLKDKNNITDVVSSYVQLKRNGKNMVGKCPFHSEKTPSFFVYPNTDSYYCFGCGAGGDVINFIERIENLDFNDSVSFLAERVGMEVPKNDFDDSLSRLRKRIFEANRKAANFFYKSLFTPEGKKALDYLTDRGLTRETIKHFGLGYSPSDLYSTVNYLKNLGYTDYELVQANLAVKTKYNKIISKFNDRVMYPLIDLKGNIVAFGGRTMQKDAKAKYINTSDTPVFKKSNNIYALNFAKNSSTKQFIIVEGYMDVISLHQAGFENAIASMGTAFTFDQAKLLSRYCDSVILCFDSDEAGEKATKRAIEIMRSAEIPIKILRIPGNKDPDEFIRSNGEFGPAKFQKLIDECKNDIDFTLAQIKNKYNLENNSDKIAYLNEAVKVVAGLNNPVEIDIYTGKLSAEASVGREAVSMLLKKERKAFINSRKKAYSSELQKFVSNIDVLETKNKRAEKSEQLLISYLFHNPNEYKYIYSKISPDKFVTDFNRTLYKTLISFLNQNLPIDISNFNDSFSADEIGKIAYIMNLEPGNRNEAEQYIKIISIEKDKINLKASENSNDEQLMKFLNNLKNSKK